MAKIYPIMISAPKPVITRGGSKNHPNIGADSHMLRDGNAMLNIFCCISDKYDLGDTFINLPKMLYKFEQFSETEQSYFSDDDILVLTTYLDIDEDRVTRKIYDTNGSILESKIQNALSHVFDHMSRSMIILNKRIATYSDYRAIQFNKNKNRYSYNKKGCVDDIIKLEALDKIPTAPTTSIGYIVSFPSFWDFGKKTGPGLLCIFSTCGTATLLFSHLVKNHRHLLNDVINQPNIILRVVEFRPTFLLDYLPTKLSDFFPNGTEGSYDIVIDEIFN